jgi:ribosomal protein S18 acetylase RimI-like enzyme
MIHWVAVRPAYQGRGLAKAAVTHVMNSLAQWHQRARLRTSSGRLAAIKIYLDFGFLPDMTQKDAPRAWRIVRAALNHPALGALGE